MCGFVSMCVLCIWIERIYIACFIRRTKNTYYTRSLNSAGARQRWVGWHSKVECLLRYTGEKVYYIGLYTPLYATYTNTIPHWAWYYYVRSMKARRLAGMCVNEKASPSLHLLPLPAQQQRTLLPMLKRFPCYRQRKINGMKNGKVFV